MATTGLSPKQKTHTVGTGKQRAGKNDLIYGRQQQEGLRGASYYVLFTRYIYSHQMEDD